MGKKSHPSNNSNRSSAPQQHLSRESGRIRQRENYNSRRQQEEEHIPPPPPQTAEEKYADNVNLLVLNLNSNPEQIYRQTIGKMLHSLTTPYSQKFKIEATVEQKKEEDEKEKEETAAAAASSGGGKDNKKGKKAENNNKNNKKQNQLHQHQNDEIPSLSLEKASFFPEDQQTATMLIRFPDKFSAKKLAQKLNQGQLFCGGSAATGVGHVSQLHASVVPTESLKPRYEPCALRITELSPEQQQQNNNNDSSFTISQLQQYLSSNPGFLSVSRVARVEDKKSNKKSASKNKNDNMNNNRCFVGTYADSGAALQARALMSGRAFHGVHLLLELIEEENEQIVPLV